MSFQPGGYQPPYQPFPFQHPAPPPPPPRKRRLALWIGLAVAGAALVGGTIWGAVAESQSDDSSGGSAFGSGSGPAQSEVTTGDTKVVTASDRKSQLTVPASWKDVPESFRNELAVIQLGHLRKEQYVAVITGDKVDFDDFSGFEQACVEEVQMVLEDADTGDRRSLTVGGLPAVQYEITGRVSGLKAVFWVTLVEGRNGFYQVLAWTLPSKRNEAEATIMDVINSFRELEAS